LGDVFLGTLLGSSSLAPSLATLDPSFGASENLPEDPRARQRPVQKDHALAPSKADAEERAEGRERSSQGVRDQLFADRPTTNSLPRSPATAAAGTEDFTTLAFAAAPLLELLRSAGSARGRLPPHSLAPHGSESSSPAGSSSPRLPAMAPDSAAGSPSPSHRLPAEEQGFGAGRPVPLSLSVRRETVDLASHGRRHSGSCALGHPAYP
jgi:hypothetical protein